jgi:hypothetical protein
MEIKDLIINLKLIRDELKSYILKVSNGHGEFAVITNFFISIIFNVIIFIFFLIDKILILIARLNSNLKNSLIIIFVLVCLYYFISPYQNCIREESNSCEGIRILLYQTKKDCVSGERFLNRERCNSAASW